MVVAVLLCGIAGCGGCRKGQEPTAVSRHKDPEYQAKLKYIAANELPRLQREIKAAGTNKAEIVRLREAYLEKTRAVIRQGIWKEYGSSITQAIGRISAKEKTRAERVAELQKNCGGTISSNGLWRPPSVINRPINSLPVATDFKLQ